MKISIFTALNAVSALLVVCFATTVSAQSVQNEWLGPDGGDWFNATHWSVGIPQSEHDVLINQSNTLALRGNLGNAARLTLMSGLLHASQNGVLVADYVAIATDENTNGRIRLEGSGTSLVASEIDVGVGGDGALHLLDSAQANFNFLRMGSGSESAIGRVFVGEGVQWLNAMQVSAGPGQGVLAFDQVSSFSTNASITGTVNVVVDAGPGGVVALAGNNQYTGGTEVISGELQVGAFNSASSLVGNVLNSATLSFKQQGVLSFPGQISGTGQVVVDGADTSVIFENDQTYTGLTTIRNGTLQLGTGMNAGRLIGDVILDNGQLVIDRIGSLAITEDISGNGHVVQAGGVAITTPSFLGFSGTWELESGRLVLNNTYMTSDIVVGNAHARLEGNGYSPSLLTHGGGNVSPGGDGVIGRFEADYFSAARSDLYIDIGSHGVSDKIVVLDSANVSGAGLHLNVLPGADIRLGDTYTIIENFSSRFSVFSGLHDGDLIEVGNHVFRLKHASRGGDVTITAVKGMQLAEKMGQLAVLPYFSVYDDNKTEITLKNHSNTTLAIKGSFTEALNGLPILDWNVYLRPYEEYRLNMYSFEGGARVNHIGNACEVPFLNNQMVFPYLLNDPIGPNLERLREGSVFFMVVGEVVGETAAAINAGDCSIVYDHWTNSDGLWRLNPDIDIIPPRGVVSATAKITNVGGEVLYEYDSTNIQEFLPPGDELNRYPGMPFPGFPEGQTRVLINQQTFDFANSFDAFSALLAANAQPVRFASRGTQVGNQVPSSSLVMYFPMKQYYTDPDNAFEIPPVPPFSTVFDSQGACESYGLRLNFDHGPVVQFDNQMSCWTANVVDINGNASALSNFGNIVETSESGMGTAEILFDGGFVALDGTVFNGPPVIVLTTENELVLEDGFE